jgi:hypothetical protein
MREEKKGREGKINEWEDSKFLHSNLEDNKLI